MLFFTWECSWGVLKSLVGTFSTALVVMFMELPECVDGVMVDVGHISQWNPLPVDIVSLVKDAKADTSWTSFVGAQMNAPWGHMESIVTSIVLTDVDPATGSQANAFFGAVTSALTEYANIPHFRCSFGLGHFNVNEIFTMRKIMHNNSIAYIVVADRRVYGVYRTVAKVYPVILEIGQEKTLKKNLAVKSMPIAICFFVNFICNISFQR